MYLFKLKTVSILLLLLVVLKSNGQQEAWSYKRCIEYALAQNISIKQAELDVQKSEVNYKQSKYNQLPSVSGSVSQSFGMSKTYDQTSGEYGDYNTSSSTSYGVNASVSLFNGLKQKNEIAQSKLQLESGKFYSETVKESVELNILDAYLAILYASEEVNNAEKQIETTQEQLNLANERFDLGIISKSDLLEVKSELASEKLTLANATSTLTMQKIALMQLMELPVTNDFEIVFPEIDKMLPSIGIEDAATVYLQAVEIKPQIKEAKLTVESTNLEKKIAKADLLPSLSLRTGLNSGFSGTDNFALSTQISNSITPTAGLTLSIPIFQKNQVKTNIKLAQISIENAKLNEIDTKNSLRKEIEQAVADLNTANIKYAASEEQFNASKEAYVVAEEKYKVGIINTVDFMLVKNNLIEAESTLLQTKFNLLFSSKIIDFYKGTPIQFVN